MLENKDYCDYKTCVALKELGYVGSSRYYYTQRDHKFHYDAYNKFYTVRTADAMGYVLAIRLYEAQKWLREEKGIDVMVIRDYWCVTRYNPYCRNYFPKLYRKCGRFEKAEAVGDEPTYDSYEEALSEGIKEAVKILKETEDE